MLLRPFEISPSPREAAQLALVVHPTAYAAACVISLLRGYGAGPADFSAMTLGLLSALGVSALLYLAFRLAAGRPGWAAYLIVALAVTACTLLQTGADFGAQHLVHLFAPGMELPPHDRASLGTVAFTYFCLYTANAALYWITFANRKTREQAAELAEANAQAALAELRALRLQLNPHFLFNSLNSALSLVSAGRNADAQAMLHRLSDFLRSALTTNTTQKVAFAEELDAAGAYLEVEAVRFPDRIGLQVDCPPDVMDALVPDFLLQPLVENAVKHAAGPGGRADIRVGARLVDGRLEIEVANGLSGETGAADGFGIGQGTTRTRLRALYGEAAEMEAAVQDGLYRVRIRLPFEREGARA